MLSRTWTYDPVRDAIVFDAEAAGHHFHAMGIEIEALARVADITSAPPDAMGELYLQNIAHIGAVATSVLLSGRVTDRDVLMLRRSDFRAHRYWHRRRPIGWIG